MDFVVVTAKLVMVFLFAGLFGLNRQRAHKPIGFGTFIFVAIGSCALAITARELSNENPLPLLSAIVTGIGFLGAGAMIKTTDKIFGVTTAAGIWLFAIFGLLVGAGEFYVSLVVYTIVWAVISIDSVLEKKGMGSYQRKVIVTTNITITEQDMNTILDKSYNRHKLLEFSIDKKEQTITRNYLIEGTGASISQLPSLLEKETGFIKCSMQ